MPSTANVGGAEALLLRPPSAFPFGEGSVGANNAVRDGFRLYDVIDAFIAELFLSERCSREREQNDGRTY